MSKSIKIFFLSLALLGLASLALAQEISPQEVIEETGAEDMIIATEEPEVSEAEITQIIDLDEEVIATDLEIKKPKILPDSRIYFLKNWGRAIRSFFTFNPVKKAELKLRFANEKLIEVKKLVELKKDPEIIKKGLENYEEEIDKIKLASEKIKKKASEEPEVGKFLDKFTKHQVLHQRVLQKLENQVPEKALEKIRETKEEHLRKFGEVMIRLEAKEKIQERLEKNLQEVEGSKFKEFKNLEVLKELEEKVPEQAKEAIIKAQENTLRRLKENAEEWSPEDQVKFKGYIEKISGVKENQLEILENLKSELRETPQIMNKLDEARVRIIRKLPIEAIRTGCPKVELPTSDFCKKGRIVPQKDNKGCIVDFKCIVLQEIETKPILLERKVACITLWDPVCGKDGKTYSNACFAKVAGVEVNYKGVCKEDKEMPCEGKCKSLGYPTGICRSWAVTADVAKAGCKADEKNAGQTPDCRIPTTETGQTLIGVGKTCCCQKITPTE